MCIAISGKSPREKRLLDRYRKTEFALTRDQVRQIAETKLRDLNAHEVEAAMRQIEGTARSMGIEVL